VSRLDQVAHHRQAHGAQSDETDLHRDLLGRRGKVPVAPATVGERRQ
jgi:hypothetical protein